MKKKRYGKSIFINYLLSYTGLVLFVFSLIAFLFINISYRNMLERDQQHVKEKMELALEDMEGQFDIFKTIEYSIAVNKVYQPSYFQRNKYYERELLEDLSRYENYSPICSNFFLYYQDNENLFLSNAQSSDLTVYLKNRGLESPQIAKNTLGNLQGGGVLQFQGLDDVILVAPIYSYQLKISKPPLLCFLISPQVLSQRLQSTSGMLDGNFALYWNDILLTSPVQQARQSPTLITQADSFQLEYYPTGSMVRLGEIFKVIHILLLLLAILFVVFLAILLAYRNFKPIRSVLRKYRLVLDIVDPESTTANELEQIDYILGEALDAKYVAGAELAKQRDRLKNQTLVLLFHGILTSKMDSHLAHVGIHIPGPYYFVCIVAYETLEPLTPFEAAEIIQQLEGLSDTLEDRFLYAYKQEKEAEFVLLCSVGEEEGKLDTLHLVEELLDTTELDYQINVGNTFTEKRNINLSYLRALSQTRAEPATLIEEDHFFPDHPFDYDASHFYQVLSAVREEDKDAALRHWDDFCSYFQDTITEYIRERYVINDIIGKIADFCKENHIMLTEPQAELVASSDNLEVFSRRIPMVIEELISEVSKNRKREQRDEAYQVMTYLHKNACDYELTINKIADALLIPGYKVSQIIRDETGAGYKDYLIALRIEQAQKLLLSQPLTVKEICFQVGYTNISHFIKVFKQITGVTPGAYRREMSI